MRIRAKRESSLTATSLAAARREQEFTSPSKPSLIAIHGRPGATLRKFHQGGDIGGYDVKESSEHGFTRYIVTASTPYPCSLTRGYLEGFARRFKSPDVKEILVRHDETTPCRRHGADTCTYIVTCW